MAAPVLAHTIEPSLLVPHCYISRYFYASHPGSPPSGPELELQTGAHPQLSIPWDPQLAAELQELRQQLASQRCGYLVEHISGAMQPADEPSRGRELLPDKMSEAVKWLTEGSYPWCAMQEKQLEEARPPTRGRRVDN